MARLSLVATIAVLTLVPTGSGAGGAALSLADRDPLILQGRRFRPYEQTRVIVVTQTRDVKTVRATAAGRFTVRFAALDVPRCGGVFATARGRAGSFARLKIPLPACQPTAQP